MIEHKKQANASATITANQHEKTSDIKTSNDINQATQEIANFKANYVDRSDIKPTRKRYLILLLFCLHSAINAMQWIYLASITNTVAKYYSISNLAINWTSMVYMLMYIPLVVPSTWLFERMGMRNSILVGSLGTSIGSLIKCFCCEPNRFYLLMVGQTIVATSQLFVLSVPPRLASVWFPDHQVSLANACGVFGNQFGIALGFVVPQLVLGDELTLTMRQIGSGLLALFVGIAAFSSTVTMLIVFLFDETPLKAPGLARLQQIKQENAVAEAGVQPLVLADDGAHPGGSSSSLFGGFLALLKDLMTDINFVLLMVSYGLNVGVFYAISTVLNQMISPNWSNANALVGQLGLVMVVFGMFGSVVSGFILDRTRMYRLVNAGLYSLSLVSIVVFTVTLEKHNLVALYLSVAALGYFMTGYLFIGYEMSNEITWPRPESVTAGLLNLSAQVSC